jgi:RND family efflux transporter MFP subunit
MTRFLFAGLLAVTVAACGSGSASPAPKAAPLEPAITVRAETLATVLPVSGTVAARQRAEIATRLMARIARVAVDVGSRVTAGAPLIHLGGDDIASARDRAAAAVRAARAARDEAARQTARMDTLYASDVVSQVQRDQAHLALIQAESQLALAQAAAQDAETAAGYATLAAPFAGVVVARYVDAGDLASPGTPLLVLESRGPRDAVLDVPIDIAARLRRGDTLRVTSDDGREAMAPIRAVAGGADQRTRTVEVRAVLPADWPTGLGLTAYIPAGAHPGIAVPGSSVVRRGQLTGVRVVEAGATTLRWVRLGRTLSDGRIEVLSGLEPGERVAQ